MLFSNFAFATADGPDYYQVIKLPEGYFLNVRSAPNLNGTILGSLPHDAKYLQNLGCVGGATYDEYMRGVPGKPRWCKIKYEDLEGWSSGKYLGEGPNPE